jgi:hypothetical protein
MPGISSPAGGEMNRLLLYNLPNVMVFRQNIFIKFFKLFRISFIFITLQNNLQSYSLPSQPFFP